MFKLIGLLPLLLLLSTAAHAEVYRCQQSGKIVYTDVPCGADAQPANLPPLAVVPALPAPDLAKRYDQRLKRETASRDQADAAFLKQHAASKQREQLVRAAILNHRVLKGMSESEVNSALGAADEIGGNADQLKWIYHLNGVRTVVLLREGRVASISYTTDYFNGRFRNGRKPSTSHSSR